jgi:hypothetical protein
MNAQALKLIDHAIEDLTRLRSELSAEPAAKREARGFLGLMELADEVTSAWTGAPSAVDAVREQREKV